jgi:hypothetical protein
LNSFGGDGDCLPVAESLDLDLDLDLDLGGVGVGVGVGELTLD